MPTIDSSSYQSVAARLSQQYPGLNIHAEAAFGSCVRVLATANIAKGISIRIWMDAPSFLPENSWSASPYLEATQVVGALFGNENRAGASETEYITWSPCIAKTPEDAFRLALKKLASSASRFGVDATHVFREQNNSN